MRKRRLSRPVVVALSVLSAAAIVGGPAPIEARVSDFWCGTTGIREDGLAGQHAALEEQDTCPLRGSCDDPAVRDSTHVASISLRVLAHVIRSSDRSCDLSPGLVRETIDRLNAAFLVNQTGFQFDLVAIRTHEDDALAWLPECDSLGGCTEAGRVIQLTRGIYAEASEAQCNIFFSCQGDNRWGVVRAGAGTFPWSSAALSPGGGIWMNSLEVGPRPHLAPHEMGHNLGLWHTHRGVSEVSGCTDPCAEPVVGPERDGRGDFASDTPATPDNRLCEGPPGSDCRGDPWGPGQPENYMGYGPYSCVGLFTPQQVLRMQCWAQRVLRGWFSVPAAQPPGIPLRIIPNPASHYVDLAFVLPAEASAKVELFDLLGRRVTILLDQQLSAGSHRVRWTGWRMDGVRAQPGIYVTRVLAGDRVGRDLFVWRR